ncbi:MAG: hypothetical protein ABIK65_00930 [Candidatus Eisenbacteria bacterium]
MCLRRSAGIFLLSALLLTGGGCGDDKSTNPTGPADGADQLVLTLRNFEDPSPYHFALWAAGGGGAELVLRFSVKDGAPVTLKGDPISSLEQESTLASATALILTVESDTTGSAPGSHPFLAGPATEGEASLTIAHGGGGIGVDLSSATGSFLFDTPTTADITDCGRGIWWTDGEGGQGLGLPSLSGGWIYEGWVIERYTGAVYSTGRFASPGAADSDGPGGTAGPGAGYPFPGQDFVTAAGGVPVLQVDSGKFGAFVTVEPEPDEDGGPFFLQILGRVAGSGGLLLTVNNLKALPSSAYYELWAVFGDTLSSAGRFKIQNRRIVDVTTGVEIKSFPIGCNLLDASEVRVSVELTSDPDPAPSGSFVLAGDVSNNSVSLSMAHATALGFDPAAVTGSYILETPSNLNAADYRRGIWFYEEAGGTTTSTLTLPDAPSGWHYEAWLYRTSATIDTLSTGTFTSPRAADSDGAGPYADTLAAAPPFPGQDYLRGVVRDLDNGRHAVMISLEPDADPRAAGPFMVILQDADIAVVPRGQKQSMSNLSASLPTGTAAISTSRRLEMTSRGGKLPRAEVSYGGK